MTAFWPGRRVHGILLLLVGWLAGIHAHAMDLDEDRVYASDDARFRVVHVAGDLEYPWGMAFLPDGQMLVTERPGRLRLLGERGLHPEPIGGVPEVVEKGQGGLLDVAVHPRFADNGWVYLSYSAGGWAGAGTEVARGRLQDHELQEVEVIFKAEPKSYGGRHFGSRLLFDSAGYLLVTLGDRGERPQAQDLNRHPGSIIRIHDDGRVPQDNPWVGQEFVRPEIYTYGNRNVQGIVRDDARGVIWAHEHGPQGGDELNIVVAGTNYGWPVITYGRNYGIGTKIGEGTEKPGMAQPVHYWVPSIAPSGMALYQGDQFPGWRGNLLVGSLKFQQLVRLVIDDQQVVAEERLLDGVLGRIRDVRSGPDGFVYLLIDAPDGSVVRLEPAAGE